MKRIQSVWLWGALAILGLGACNNSPLMNHARAGGDGGGNPTQPTDVNCPLDFDDEGFCAKIEWLVGPNGSEANSFRLKFWDKETGTIDGPYSDPGHDVGVQPWMPDMGHGTSPVTVEEESSGIYKATEVNFIMPGKWHIRVKLLDSGSQVERAIQRVDIQD